MVSVKHASLWLPRSHGCSPRGHKGQQIEGILLHHWTGSHHSIEMLSIDARSKQLTHTVAARSRLSLELRRRCSFTQSISILDRLLISEQYLSPRTEARSVQSCSGMKLKARGIFKILVGQRLETWLRMAVRRVPEDQCPSRIISELDTGRAELTRGGGAFSLKRGPW